MAKPSKKKPPEWATEFEFLHALAQRATDRGHVLVVLSADLDWVRDEQTGEIIAGQDGIWDEYVLSAGQYQHASGLLVLRPYRDLVCVEDIEERLDELERTSAP